MAKTEKSKAKGKDNTNKDKLTLRFVMLNVVAAIAVVALFFWGVSWFLDAYTRHGKTITVPDLSNMSEQEAIAAAKAAGAYATVEDSVYIPKLGAGIVYRQEPRAGLTVKKKRHIRLTINSVSPRITVMPNLVGYNIMEAKSEIISHGLSIARLDYVSDIATNVVLEQKINGRVVRPGTEISSGSEITLVLGRNYKYGSTTVPNLVGSKYVNALETLHDSFLNKGEIQADSGIHSYADSIQCFVYRQDPAPRTTLLMGSSVKLYLTKDESKITSK